MIVVVHGAAGSMGQVLCPLITQAGHTVIAVEREGSNAPSMKTWSEVSSCDVVIDFSHPSLLRGVVEFCLKTKAALVVGTTGLSPEDHDLLTSASQTISIIESPNFSFGVAVFRQLIQQATAKLAGFDIELIETHHVHKKDAPSGTAKQILLDIETLHPGTYHVHAGRHNTTGAKAANEIGVHSIRSGANPGEHTIVFSSAEEQVELTHKAFSRQVFAKGAWRAAEWVVQQPQGRYSMEDLVKA